MRLENFEMSPRKGAFQKADLKIGFCIMGVSMKCSMTPSFSEIKTKQIRGNVNVAYKINNNVQEVLIYYNLFSYKSLLVTE